MRKLLLVLFICAPFFGIAQNRVTLRNNQQFIALIQEIYGGNLVFKKSIPQTEINYIPIIDILSIEGEVSQSRTKKLLKRNPGITFLPGEFTREDFDNQPPLVIEQPELPYLGNLPYGQNSSNKIIRSPGDLIQISSVLRLSGFAVGVGTSSLLLTDVIKDLDTQKTVGIVAGVVSLGLYIAGEITLFKAGTALNREAVTLTPASKGIGVAINF